MLHGAGLFGDIYENGWKKADDLTATSYHIDVQESVLRLRKLMTAEYEFDDGLILKFPPAQPHHIQFWCKTNVSKDAESCNLRLSKMMNEKSISAKLDQEDD